MSKRILWRTALVACLALAWLAIQSSAQAQVKAPTFLWGLNIPVRPAATPDWDKAKKFGFEVRKDENNGKIVYLSDSGSPVVISGNAAPADKTKAPSFVWGLDLKVRTGGSEDWARAKKFGVEVFKDEHNGQLLYVCENGSFAVIPGPTATKVDKPKEPTWLWGLDLKVRPAGSDDWGKAKKFGFEVFKDEHNGATVYICENGNIGVVTGNAAKADKPKTPTFLWGLDLKARVGGNDDWDKAKQFGVDVWKDDNNNVLVYMGDNGNFSLIPGGNVAKPEKSKPPEWKHGLDMKARKPGETDFDKAKLYGLEVFKDDNNGDLVYISDTGAFSVTAAK